MENVSAAHDVRAVIGGLVITLSGQPYGEQGLTDAELLADARREVQDARTAGVQVLGRHRRIGRDDQLAERRERRGATQALTDIRKGTRARLGGAA